MNQLTKIGLFAGMSALLLLGLIFRQDPGSYGSQARAALSQSEQTVAALRTDLGRSTSVAESLKQQLAAARDELDALEAQQQAAEARALKVAESDPQTRIAMLELESEGLRERLAISRATSGEMIASLNARLNARQLAPRLRDSTLDDKVRALQAKLDAAEALALERQQQVSELREQLNAVSAGRRAEPAAAVGDSAALIAALKNQFAVAGIDAVEVYPRGGGKVSVRASNSEIFSPGGTSISSLGRQILAEVGEVVNAMPQSRLQIEGHTDNIPIGAAMSGLYGSNWDLSVARAMAAVRHLQRRVGVGANRLSGAGFGEYVPVASNDTAEGRSLNRRIEIVVDPIEKAPN